MDEVYSQLNITQSKPDAREVAVNVRVCGVVISGDKTFFSFVGFVVNFTDQFF